MNPPKIDSTVKMLRNMIQPQRVPQDTKPVGPSGLPSRPLNDTDTIEGRYEGEGLVDPGVIGGVTATGGGGIIS